jgi:hypothetical protein
VLVERQAPALAPDAISHAATSDETIEPFVSPPREHVASRIPAENYLRTREVALRMGLDAIGRQPSGSGQPAPTYGDMLLDLSGMKKPVSGDKPPSSLPFNM